MATLRLVLGVSLITAMTAACAGAGASPPLTMTDTTLMGGWEQHFTIKWSTEQSRVIGYVYNRKGEYAEDVRLLAKALDPAGAVTGQHIALVGGVGSSGAYFEVSDLPAASSYRVSVWDYTWASSKAKK